VGIFELFLYAGFERCEVEGFYLLIFEFIHLPPIEILGVFQVESFETFGQRLAFEFVR
jgi:hypothetical protein